MNSLIQSQAWSAAQRLVTASYGEEAVNPVVREFAWERFVKWSNNPPSGTTKQSAITAARYFILDEIRTYQREIAQKEVAK